MGFIIGFAILIISGIIGMVLDIKYKAQDAIGFWTLGMTSGIVVGVCLATQVMVMLN